MEHFCCEVRHVANDKNNDWFDYSHMVCKTREKTSEKSVKNTNKRWTENNDKEWDNAKENVNRQNILKSNNTETSEHSVKNLNKKHQNQLTSKWKMVYFFKM